MTHEDAPESTHSPVQGSRALPDADTAGEALVQQVAEVVGNALAETWMSEEGHERLTRLVTAAVLPLVEAQVAPLRDEVARLTEVAENLDAKAGWESQNHGNDLADQTARAAAAESALRQVREVRDEAKRLADTYARCDHTYDLHARLWGDVASRLDRSLAQVAAADTVESKPRRWGKATERAEKAEADLAIEIGKHAETTARWVAAESALRRTVLARVGAAETQPEGAGEAHGTTCTVEGCYGQRPDCAYATPTAGGKVDTAPEAVGVAHLTISQWCDDCGYHRSNGHQALCPSADTAPESGEGR